MTMTAAPVTPAENAPPRPASRATPTRLRLLAGGLALLTVLAGVAAAVAVANRHAAASAAWQTSEPLVVDAQGIDTSLSEADTAAAGSFLQGRLEPVGLRAQYLADLAQASTSLATTTHAVGTQSSALSAITTLSVDLPVYTGIVQTATFNERQGFYPLAAAYIGEANNLMRTQMLPAARQLFAVERSALADDQQGALSSWLVVIAGVLLLALLVTIVATQRWMSGHFRRTFNVPLVAATVLIVVVGLWFGVSVGAETSQVDTATANGSGPLSVSTQARILALQLRADDELTLLSQDSVSSYQADYGTAAAALQHLFSVASSTAGPAERQQLVVDQRDVNAYRLVHDEIRLHDGRGEWNDALSLAAGTGTGDLPAVSANLDAQLVDGIASSQQTFDNSMSSATTNLTAALYGIVVLSLLIAALIIVGFRPRIAEYR